MTFENPTEPVRANTIPENMIFLTGEPPELRSYRDDFLRQFRWVVTCHDIKHQGLIASHQSQPWFVGVDCDRGYQATLDYDSLSKMTMPEKPFLISAAISDKAITEGHRQRLQLVRLLKERLGADFHILGQGHQPFADKWEAVAPYRFHLALENAERPNYVTEKIGDAFLGYAFPLYSGAPNIIDFYPEGSLEPIDISRPLEAIRTICKAIDNNLDVQRRQEVALARKTVFDEFNLFPRMVKMLRERMVDKPKQSIQLYPKNQHFKLAWSGLRRNLRRAA